VILLLLPLLAFLFATLVVVGAAYAFAPGGPSTIERRLGEVTGAPTRTAESSAGYEQSILTGLKRIGSIGPKSPKEMTKLQQRLVMAGFRSREALVVFFGVRMGFALLTFALISTGLVGLMARPNLFVALGGCGFGYLLPSMVLGRLAKRRQHRIRLGLPDVLDLLVVSVEAGLGLDQAIQRVGEELAFAHPDLSDELRLINLELRAGKGRSDALRNLAERTGVDDVQSLVAMLVQTDKFGTSVAQSLRVHSETVRTKRRQRAEEAAAKTGVKMVFPLVFCIFPAIWVVTIGPAAIKFVQVLLPMAQN
jgi:tight adherence protein C